MTPETEIAWAAGFFDGEGCTHLTSEGYLAVSVGQCDPEVLRRFAAVVGGAMYGPYAKRQPGWNPIWYVRLQGWPAVAAIKMLWPYLGSVKRLQYFNVRGVARMPHRLGYCKKDKHRLTPENREPDGRCRPCRQSRTNIWKKENGRVSP